MEIKKNKTVIDRLKAMGPGAIVTAAVVGPGTVTTCGTTGAKFGFAMVWCLVFSVIAMAIMQRITAKIGYYGGMGLADAIRQAFKDAGFVRYIITALVIMGIFFGNCAYQAGNVVGAATGVGILFGNNRVLYCTIISAVALALVLSGSIKYIANFLTGLVFIMAIVFLLTAIMVKPDLGELFSGVIPSIPDGAQLNAIGLIGTTLVPYCLYLHASTAASKKQANPDMDVEDALVDATYDSVSNAILTLIISVSIMVVGYSLVLNGGEVKSVTDLAAGLEPLAGNFARIIFAVGIFAAGISSATTAPLAATYVITGILGWSTDLKDKRFRVIAFVVFFVGFAFAAFNGSTPTEIVTIAQAINGVVLPLSVVLAVYVATKSEILGKYTNKTVMNVLGVLVLVITLFMAYRTAVTYAPQIMGWFVG